MGKWSFFFLKGGGGGGEIQITQQSVTNVHQIFFSGNSWNDFGLVHVSPNDKL